MRLERDEQEEEEEGGDKSVWDKKKKKKLVTDQNECGVETGAFTLRHERIPARGAARGRACVLERGWQMASQLTYDDMKYRKVYVTLETVASVKAWSIASFWCGRLFKPWTCQHFCLNRLL